MFDWLFLYQSISLHSSIKIDLLFLTQFFLFLAFLVPFIVKVEVFNSYYRPLAASHSYFVEPSFYIRLRCLVMPT